MALLRIERAIQWIARALTANRDGNPVPTGYINFILPAIDVFGSQRIEETQIATVIGALGGIEVAHDQVPDGRIRHYLSINYSHDDPITRFVLPGRIIPTGAGFPFAGFRDQESTPPNRNFAVRNIILGPGQFLGIRSNAMGAAARMQFTVAWLEMPVGEYSIGVE